MKLFSLLLLMMLSTAPAYSDQIERVLDGDTIIVKLSGGASLKVRLLFVDAPELSQPYGPVAKQHLVDLIAESGDITIRGTNLDKYGRTLGVVSSDRYPNMNMQMVLDGFAWDYLNKKGDYLNAQNLAKNAKIGLWQDENPEPPWAYRKSHKHTKKSKYSNFLSDGPVGFLENL